MVPRGAGQGAQREGCPASQEAARGGMARRVEQEHRRSGQNQAGTSQSPNRRCRRHRKIRTDCSKGCWGTRLHRRWHRTRQLPVASQVPCGIPAAHVRRAGGVLRGSRRRCGQRWPRRWRSPGRPRRPERAKSTSLLRVVLSRDETRTNETRLGSFLCPRFYSHTRRRTDGRERWMKARLRNELFTRVGHVRKKPPPKKKRKVKGRGKGQGGRGRTEVGKPFGD